MTESDLPTAELCAEAWQLVFRLFGVAPSSWLDVVAKFSPHLLTDDKTAMLSSSACSPTQIQRYARAHGKQIAVPKKNARDTLRTVFTEALKTIDGPDDQIEASSALSRALEFSKRFHLPKSIANTGSTESLQDRNGEFSDRNVNPRIGQGVLTMLDGDPVLQAKLSRHNRQKLDSIEAEEAYLGLSDVLKTLETHLAIKGDEAHYFKRWMEIFRSVENETVIAFIRPLTGTPPSWYEGFYKDLRAAVLNERLELSYYFFEAYQHASSAELAGVFGTFAREVRFVCPQDFKTTSYLLRPSFVLFTRQRIALSFDRDDNGSIINAKQWSTPRGYGQFESKIELIKAASYSAAT